MFPAGLIRVSRRISPGALAYPRRLGGDQNDKDNPSGAPVEPGSTGAKN
jgi:hypothetical protein